MKKKLLTILMGFALVSSLTGCSEADTVSQNLSKSADNFKVNRKVYFINGITDKYLLTVEGKCSLDASSAKKVAVICKIGEDKYIKHYMGLSDNVTYVVEQTTAKYEDPFHYKIVFRPESIVPDIDLQTSK